MESGNLTSEFDSEAVNTDLLISNLQSGSRLKRQKAAAVFFQMAQVDPQKVLPFADALVEALECEEARTRWSALDALNCLLVVDPKIADIASDAAEDALFDEDNGSLRLSAMRFVCKVGSVSPESSLEAWASIDEALQCFHGDAEFNDMLAAVAEFAAGNIDQKVKEGLASRLSFDAQNARGTLKKRAQAIIDIVS